MRHSADDYKMLRSFLKKLAAEHHLMEYPAYPNRSLKNFLSTWGNPPRSQHYKGLRISVCYNNLNEANHIHPYNAIYISVMHPH